MFVVFAEYWQKKLSQRFSKARYRAEGTSGGGFEHNSCKKLTKY